MKPIIEVNHVWKEYQKGIDRRYKSLRDTLVGMPNRFFGAEKEKFWALEDIDFKVEAGESVGIIGRNGAGKSTLLKILSRITPPSKGEIILRGRVSSLLEVGTGFHPELTGRENVFFNGSILGMKNQEIKRKFDEIVDFSGVENFIDTPLKHFSSGMQMRLAFSVAAHLDSEILLIDEVLAVGDAEFQKKCIGKMDDVSKGEGKTILFVSHDIKSIIELTKIAILLDEGILKSKGESKSIISEYLEYTDQNIKIYTPTNLIQRVSVKNESYLTIECKYKLQYQPYIPHFGFIISTSENIPLFASNPTIEKIKLKPQNNKEGTIRVNILEPKLAAGLYRLSIWMGDGSQDFFSDINCLQFNIYAHEINSKFGCLIPRCSYEFIE